MNVDWALFMIEQAGYDSRKARFLSYDDQQDNYLFSYAGSKILIVWADGSVSETLPTTRPGEA